MKRLSFDDMVFSRNSPAWCPITGNSVGNNTPRIVENLVYEYVKEPVIYYRFDNSQGFTAYSEDGYTRPGETTHYLGDLKDSLENISASPDRILLGTSYEGRDIEAFRLGPVDREHFMITNAIHGNEVDGLTGSFKAVELIMTHPDFAALREKYSIMYVPCCNPDGHYNATRSLAKYGPNPSGIDQLINLNRVWPWFWSEYVPSLYESKGASEMDCLEATALYNYVTAANGGSAVPIGFLLDQHSTVGDGARYQSRDKCYREYDEQDWFSIWSDWYIWKYLKAMQAKRIHEDSEIPDLWVNYYRSRFRPHWHSWMGTRTKAENGGVPIVSMVCEHNKVAYVDVTSDPETYKSACDFNMDYILASALVMQGGVVSPRTSVLLEHEVGDNQVQNSDFESWQKKTADIDPAEYRPGYYTPTRSTVIGYARSEKHMNHHGECFKLTPNILIEIPEGQNAGPDNFHDVQTSIGDSATAYFVVNIDSGGSAVHRRNQSTYGGDLEQLFTDSSLPNDNEKRFAGIDSSDLFVLDLGNTGQNLKLISYDTAAYSRTVEDTFTEPRLGAACAFDGTSKTYIVGGDNTSSKVQTVLVADRTAGTISELGTNLLTTADSYSEATYCSGGTLDGLVIVIGGSTTSTGNLRIVSIDPSIPSASETLFSVSGTTLPDALVFHAIVYDGIDSIYIYGGEDPSDNSSYRGVWKLSYSGSAWSVSELTLTAGVGEDPDPVDYNGIGEWEELWSRWRPSIYTEANEGTSQVLLLGGVEEDPDTGLKISQDYRGMFVHDILDEIIHRPQDYVFAYVRYNYAISPAGAYDKVAVSWSTKAADDALASYIRLNTAPGDSGAGLLSTRQNHTYYQHSPKWWMRNQSSLDFNAQRPDRNEDQWRLYCRVYRHGQASYIDSPMVQTGTLWPSSWSPYGITRESESATWADSVDPRRMRVKFVWMPSASFLCAYTDFKLLSIDDGTRKIEVWSVTGDRTERIYRRGYTYSNAEQELELRVYDDLGAYTSCTLPCFWGGMHKDVANDRFDSSITIEVWAHPDHGHGFMVNHSGAVGRNSLLGKFTASDWASTADVVLAGGGWWAEPDVYAITKKWIKSVKTPFVNGSLLMGDRDPGQGLVDPKSPFRYKERFTRTDDSNLGSYWDIIQQTGAGFNILNNRAVCTEVGWERWDAQPNIRDCAILGTVRINNNECRVGFFARMSWDMASNGEVNGYLGSLYVDASGDPYLQIERFYMNTGSQARTTLISTACTYTKTEDVKLEFEVIEDDLTVYLRNVSTDAVISSTTVTDSNIARPDAFGICGETPSSITSVEIDDVYAEVRGVFKTRITE